uniref:Uncharacterized protein n=1 Tax=Arundo donax TaxID=35708 RepID=A0A0A9A425_ARUDO
MLISFLTNWLPSSPMNRACAGCSSPQSTAALMELHMCSRLMGQ